MTARSPERACLALIVAMAIIAQSVAAIVGPHATMRRAR